MTTRAHPLEDLGDETGAALVQLARALHLKDAGLQPTLDAIIAHAVDTIDPAEHAGLILVLRGRLAPQATLGDPPHLLDQLQQHTGRGPCLDAAREQTVITIHNTLTETRWPEFAERAAQLGVASMVCVPLWVDELRLGTLSLYGEKPDAFAPQHRQLTDLYAAHAAIALADAQRTAKLHEAMTNRDIIGQAKGILIERLKLTPDAAFARLSRHPSTQTSRCWPSRDTLSKPVNYPALMVPATDAEILAACIDGPVRRSFGSGGGRRHHRWPEVIVAEPTRPRGTG